MSVPFAPRTPKESQFDEAFLRAFRAGEEWALLQVYESFGYAIYRFCLRMLRSEEQAKDALQETFLKVIEHCHTLQTAAVKSWVYTIARNVCLNILRQQKQERWREDLDPEQLPDLRVDMPDFLLQNILHTLIHSLPLSYREPLILRDSEGLSYAEIAEILSMSEGAVRVRVHRARMMLRKKLENVLKVRE